MRFVVPLPLFAPKWATFHIIWFPVLFEDEAPGQPTGCRPQLERDTRFPRFFGISSPDASAFGSGWRKLWF
jgi:hypothetical protein